MMKPSLALMLVLAAGGLALAEVPKSGPQVGERIPGAFLPYNVTGDDAGQRRCQV